MLRDYIHHLGRFQVAARLFLAGEFLAGIGQGAFWVLRNLYLKELGYNEGFIGLSFSVSLFGLWLVALPLSRYMDRGPLKTYLIFGALAIGAGIAGTAWWPSDAPILLSGFIAGAGMALLSVGSVPFYMRISTPSERPFLFGVGSALMPASGLVGTGLVWALSFAWGDKVSGMGRMMILSGAIAAAGAILFALIREMKVPVPVREHLEADHRAVFRLGLPLAVIGLGAGLTIPFINLYFEHRFHFTPRNVSVAFSAAQMVSFFAFLASPLLARRFGGVRTVIACQLLSIPFFLVMAFTGLSSLAVAAFLARHALMNMAGPVTSQFAMEVVSPHKRVRTNGLIESSRNGTFLLGTAAGGWVIDARLWGDGYTATMLMTIALYLTGSAIFYFFWRTSSALTPRATPTPIHELDS